MNNTGRTIVIDYLNIFTLIYIKIFKYTNVFILYKHAFLNEFYILLLNLTGVKIDSKYLMYSDLHATHIYKQSIREKRKIVDRNFDIKNTEHDIFYRDFFYDHIHPIVELKYILSSLSFEKILINYPNYMSKLLLDDNFYSVFSYYHLPSFAFNGNKRYFNRDLYFKKNIFFLSSIYRIVKSFINIRLHKNINIQADVLTYVHPIDDNPYRKYLNNFNYLKKLDIDYIELNPHKLTLQKNGEFSHLYSLRLNELFTYIYGLFRNCYTILRKDKMSLVIFSQSVFYAKNIFFFNKIIQDYKIRVALTSYEGDLLLNTLNRVCIKSKTTISVCYSWSLGDFIGDSTAYKEADVFLAWGKWQEKQGKDFGELYRSIVTVGYVGDCIINRMLLDTKKLINNKGVSGRKIISVYDDRVGLDGYVTYTQLNNFYEGVVDFLIENKDYSCIIKSKWGWLFLFLRSDVAKKIKNLNKRIIYVNNHADIGPALVSDIVYAFSVNTIGSVALAWGKKVIFYDEGGIFDNDFLLKKLLVASSTDDFINKSRIIAKFRSQSNSDSVIDPYADGLAQYRVSEYICLLLTCNNKDKQSIIDFSDNIFVKKYGSNKVYKN